MSVKKLDFGGDDMSANQPAAGARVGRFLGRAYQRYARTEANVLRALPKALARIIKVAVRTAMVGMLLYFVLVPTLLAVLAVGVLLGLSRGSIDGDLFTMEASPEPELFHGNEGYGMYQDGVRIG